MEKSKKKKEKTFKLCNDLILVRHAEAQENKYISNDLLPLTNLGVQQAKEVYQLLKNRFDIVISSTSKRAIMTANIILSGKDPIQDCRLLERGWGNVEQNGKETDEQAKIRIADFLSYITRKYRNRRILLVTHGSLMKIAQDVIESNIIERDCVNNCTTILYSKEKEKTVLKP